jgi:hypothetical protein
VAQDAVMRNPQPFHGAVDDTSRVGGRHMEVVRR